MSAKLAGLFLLFVGGALSQTTTIDLFDPYDDFVLQDYGVVNLVDQGPTTTRFEFTATGWMAPYCPTPVPIVEGPNTFSMIIPNFSELYISKECTMTCNTATCTHLLAVNTPGDTPARTTTITGLSSFYDAYTITGALPTSGPVATETCSSSA